MSEQTVEFAWARYGEICAALTKITKDFAELGSFIRTHYKMENLRQGTPFPEPPTFNDQPSSTSHQGAGSQFNSPPHPSAKMTVVSQEVAACMAACREAIGAANKPLPLTPLNHALRLRGYIIKTVNPPKTLSTRLRDNAEKSNFIFLAGFGWWLAEREYIPAGYVPSSNNRSNQHVR